MFHRIFETPAATKSGSSPRRSRFAAIVCAITVAAVIGLTLFVSSSGTGVSSYGNVRNLGEDTATTTTTPSIHEITTKTVEEEGAEDLSSVETETATTTATSEKSDRKKKNKHMTKRKRARRRRRHKKNKNKNKNEDSDATDENESGNEEDP